jgi:hypothetical protein
MPTLSPEQVGVWTICFLLALDVFLRIAAHLREKKSAEEGTRTIVSPTPLEVKTAVIYTPLAKHDELVKRVEKIDEKIDERISGLAEASSKGREKIYTQLGEQRMMLAKNTEKTDLTYAQVQQLDAKIDRLLARPVVHTT